MLHRVIILQPLLTPILHAIVHHPAFATLGRSPHNLPRCYVARGSPVVASGGCALLNFLLKNSSASVLDSCGLPADGLLLRHFLGLVVALIVFTALPCGCNLITLLLNLVGLLSFVSCWAGLSALASHAS